MKIAPLTITTICILAFAAGARAGRLDVPDDYPTIQDAIDAAANGDEIVCSDGTYSGPGNRDIDFLGKAITVRSESGPENCIIDCEGTQEENHRGFYFHSGEDANSIVDGFTITNGYAPEEIIEELGKFFKLQAGGVIFCVDASPTILNCTISANVAKKGGAMYCGGASNPTIANCTISANSAVGGGAIESVESSFKIINCGITNNSARGGGAILASDSNCLIINCTVSGNSAEDGGGIYCDYSNVTITDCNISGNLATRGAGFYCGGCGRNGTYPVIKNCTITGNIAVRHGGAIFCWESSPTIADCTISGNSGELCAGAIACWESSPKITNCTISGNSAEDGGAIYCQDHSNPTMTNCSITSNLATRSGGAIYNFYSSPTITNCTFYGNSVEQYGGAIYCNGGNPEITRCAIVGNSAGLGGGIHSETSSPTITDCTISDNSAREGGAIYTFYSISLTITNCMISGSSANNGGGIYMRGGNPTVANCIISGNISHKTGFGPHGHGGGIFCWESEPAIVNCTITGNVASKGGGLNGCRGPISNCIIWDNSADNGPQLYNSTEPNYSCIQGWSNSGEDNIDADPCFVEPGYWDANDVWVEGDYHLLEDSPCIDSGDPNYVPQPKETDIDGKPRVLDGNEDGTALVDMGAYEYLPPVEAEMTLTPHALSCASKGRWVKAHIILPEGYLPEDIDVNTPAVALPMDVESEYMKVFAGGKGPVSVEIRFDRAAFCDALTETGEIEVTVTSSLTTGREFYATDTIKIKPNPRPIIRKLLKTGLNKPHSGKLR